MATATDLTDVQKIALILGTLPDDQCVEVLKNYPEDEVERICAEMVNPAKVDDEARVQVLKEFSDALAESGDQDGLDAMEGVLARLYGARRSTEIVQRLKASSGGDAKPFAVLAQEAGPAETAKALARESPGTAAFALVELPNAFAAKVLILLPGDVRAGVLLARARGVSLRSEMAQWFREGLRASLVKKKDAGPPPPAPSEILASAEILSQLASDVSKGILEALTKEDPELGQKVAEALFTFDDLVRVEDKDLQRLLGKINQADLKIALRKCSESVTEKVFKNMSGRVGEALKEEIQISPPQKMAAVQEAQRRIAASVRDMVRNGEIVLKPVERAAAASEGPPAEVAPEDQLV
jgi:flagellar motor switch protein FliG